MTALERTQKALDILQHSGDLDYIGEPISQLEHALQCGARALKLDASDELVLAALFHDIGHFSGDGHAEEMDGYGVLHHEEIGAKTLLQLGFADQVAELVRGHVQAKRYLVSKKPGYMDGISEASLKTLQFQGGPMNAAEAAAFERDPLFKDKLRLRQWDELAKDTDAVVPNLESYRARIEGHLKRSAL